MRTRAVPIALTVLALAAMPVPVLGAGKEPLVAVPGPAHGRTLVAVPAESRPRVAMIPFTPRGTSGEAWSRLRGAIADRISLAGLVPVGGDRVEDYLRERRLRDTSLLAREEIGALAASLEVEWVLLGEIYRFDAEPAPAVSISGRLVRPGTGTISAMTVAVVEGVALERLLGIGGAVTLDQVIAEAAGHLAEGLVNARQAKRTRHERDLRRVSVLAPDPGSFLSPDLAAAGIRTVLVLPFRNETRNPGAGRIAADLAAWSLLEAEGIEVIEAGDAARRLLANGWRTGQPVGAPELAALREHRGVDAVVMGRVDVWQQGRLAGTPPHVAVSARLLAAGDGAILWSSAHDRVGNETRILYEHGNVRLAEALMSRAISEMMKPLVEVLDGALEGTMDGQEQARP